MSPASWRVIRHLATVSCLVASFSMLAGFRATADAPASLPRSRPALDGFRDRPDASVMAFVQRTRAGSGWRVDRDGLESAAWMSLGEYRVARIRQRYAGHPVLGGEVRVVVDGEARVRFVNGELVRGLHPPDAATVDEAGARRIALGAAADPNNARVREAALAVTRLASGDHWVWVVAVEQLHRPGAEVLWVDGNTGGVLSRSIEGCHAPAAVYLTDPRAPMVERELIGLAGDSTRLIRTDFSSENRGLEPLVVPDHDFRFFPGHPLADRQPEVNAFWHAQRFFGEFLPAAGYAGPALPVVVRVDEDLSPFIALTSGPFVFLGAPIAGLTRDAALADDIVAHELQHTVTFGFGVTATGPNREALALHEGLSDFMAACVTADPAIGEWAYIPFPNGVTRVDRPASTFHYSNYDRVAFGGVGAGSGWANGMILSGALWDLRAILGPLTEQLVLRSLALLPESPQWRHFVDAMVEVDLQVAAGAHAATIVEVFAARGIRGTLSVAIEGDAVAGAGVSNTFTARVEGSLSQPVAWSVRRHCGAGPCSDWLPRGSGGTIALAESTDYELRAAVVGPVGQSESIRFIDVLLPQLEVSGPTGAITGESCVFHAEAQGVGPLAYDWWRTYQRVGGVRERIGSGPNISVRADDPFVLECRITDALGRRTTSVRDIPWLVIGIEGTDPAAPGQSAMFTASATVPLSGFALLWRALPYCGVDLCAAVADSPIAGLEYTGRFATDTRIELEAVAPWGTRIRASRFVNVLMPSVAVLGPAVTSGRESVTFVADGRAVAPYRVEWFRGESGSGLRTPIGEGLSIDVLPPSDFMLVARITDPFGRVSEDLFPVTLIDVVAANDAPGRFQLVAPVLARGAVSVQFGLPQPASASLRILDLSGREVARLWDGPLGSARTAVTWRPDEVPAGVYFLRLESQGRMLTRRISLLR